MRLDKFSWKELPAWLLAVFFLIGSFGNIFASDGIAADYARWGYPTWFHYMTGLLELSTAVLLLLKPMRFWGALLGAAIMAAAVATLALHGEYAHSIAPLVVLTIAAVVGWINRPAGRAN